MFLGPCGYDAAQIHEGVCILDHRFPLWGARRYGCRVEAVEPDLTKSGVWGFSALRAIDAVVLNVSPDVRHLPYKVGVLISQCFRASWLVTPSFACHIVRRLITTSPPPQSLRTAHKCRYGRVSGHAATSLNQCRS